MDLTLKSSEVKVVVEEECAWCGGTGYDWYPMMPGQRKLVCGICDGAKVQYTTHVGPFGKVFP